MDNQKRGLWEYYYENGNKQQILEFRKNEVLVQEFWTEDGEKLVDSGSGKWYGYESSDKFVKISGELINGRKNGTWKRIIPSHNQILNTEKYNEGVLTTGKLFSRLGGVESYHDTSYCSIEQIPTFVTAELFQMNRCYKQEKNKWEYAEYPGGMERFYKEISERLIINENDVRRGIIRVQMTIDQDGKMTNFKPVSNIGLEDELIRVLQTMDRWTPKKINGKPTIEPKIIRFEIK